MVHHVKAEEACRDARLWRHGQRRIAQDRHRVFVLQAARAEFGAQSESRLAAAQRKPCKLQAVGAEGNGMTQRSNQRPRIARIHRLILPSREQPAMRWM